MELHVLALHLPFTQSLLGTQAISLGKWCVRLLLVLPLQAVMEVCKQLWARRHDTVFAATAPGTVSP